MTKLSIFSLFITLSLFFGFNVYAVPYDYSYTDECLTKPLEPQYHGGIVVNAELNQGLKGWSNFGGARVEHRESADGNKYIVASQRKQSFHSFAQQFNLEKDKLYTFSAWLQASNGPADVAAVFKTPNSNQIAGRVTAQKGCWSMLKGGVVVNVSGPAQLYFESKDTDVELWADSISLQPFTQQEWETHQRDAIEKSRKTRVKLQATDSEGRPVRNATISIKQKGGRLPLGCAINQNILNNQAYQKWFLSRSFKYTVFENEMKWYSQEKSRGAVDYSVSDSMVRFAQTHGIAIRGHNILWDDPQYQPGWVKSLSWNDLLAAANSRIDSVAKKYRGQLIHWDVINENLHFDFFESKLGRNFSAVAFKKTKQLDPKVIPFLNEYNTIEDGGDSKSNSGAYLEKIRDMRAQGYGGPLGIGLEGHFTNVNLPYVRSTIDALSSAKLPIWITELDVVSGPNQSGLLEQLIREFISRGPVVKGIIVWSAWSPGGCYRMCLTNNNFVNLATGNVVDKFLKELSHEAENQVRGTTDSNGFFEASLFHGEYEALIGHVNGEKVHKFGVEKSEEALLHVKINTA